ncbi:MAG: ATP synthase F1 subunit delta [Actinomycetia bacterium]|nr:ATP synthase F1 subunit delta [Actinomycetes bacterium]
MGHKVKTAEIKKIVNALASLAASENQLDLLKRELEWVKEEVDYNLKFKQLLRDDQIKNSEKVKILLEILEEKVSSITQAAVASMAIMGLMEQLDIINKLYGEKVSQLKKQLDIEVISAIELDKDTIEDIKKSLDKKTQREVKIKNIVDNSIIGGLVINIDDQVMDLSISRKLIDLKSNLKEIKLESEKLGN